MSAWKRWQDWATFILGILLIISPFAFGAATTSGTTGTYGTAGMTAAFWSAIVLGILIALVSLVNLAKPAFEVGHWFELLLGFVVFVTPWVLGYTTSTRMAWSAWVIGVLCALLAASVVYSVRRSGHTGYAAHTQSAAA